MSAPITLRSLVGMPATATPIAQSALIIIDAQNTYTEGLMQLEGVTPALAQCKQLLDRFRQAGRPIFHIQHDAGAGSPYDINSPMGQIVSLLTPQAGEPVITKHYPNAFTETTLDAQLKALGIQQLILVGFMTHMCVNSTARGAFSLGYRATVVASATATRALPAAVGGEAVSASQLQSASLAGLADLPAAVVATADDVPDAA